MATSTSHQPFPSRPYTSGLGRTGGQNTFGATPYNAQIPYNAPAQNPGYGPSGAAAGALGTTGATTQQQREAQRLERERHERAERERREAEERGVLEALSEEQREEVNEAVCIFRHSLAQKTRMLMAPVASSPSSTSTKTTTSTITSSKSPSKPWASTSPNPTS